MDAPASTPVAPAESAPTQNADPQKVADKSTVGPGTQAGSGGQSPAPTPPPRRTLKFKANGQDVELDEDRAITELQMGWGAKKKFTELDKAQKDFEARKAKLKNPEDDDSEFFKELGVDRREWLEKKLARELQREAEEAEMSPDAKRARELEAKLRQVEEEKRRNDETRQQELDRQEEDRHAQLFAQHIPVALEEVGLPKSGHALERMTAYLRDQLAAKIPLDERAIKVAAQVAREDLVDSTRALISKMEGKQIVELLGDEIANKVRRYDLQRYEERKAAGQVQPPKKEEPTQKEPERPQYMSEREYNSWLNKKLGIP